MNKQQTSIDQYDPLIALVDLLAMQSCAFAIFALAQGYLQTSVSHMYLRALPLTSFATIAILSLCGLYKVENLHSGLRTILPGMMAVSLLACVWGSLCYLQPAYAIPPSLIVMLVCAQFASLLTVRIINGKLACRESAQRRVMVLIANPTSIPALDKMLTAAPRSWSTIRTYMTTEDFFAITDQLAQWDTVILTEGLEKKASLIDRLMLMQKEILVIPDSLEMAANGAKAILIGDLMMLAIAPPHLNQMQRAVKRMLDIATSLLMLALLAPIMAAIAGIVWITSKGSALFSQERVGLSGKQFQVYKFRTMIADAEKNSGPVLATANDPRITSVGRLLRSTRLDELPQLFNVLSGDMSLIGPRPERLHFVTELAAEIPGYESRLTIKPGITGLAQVCGQYASSADRKLRFDLMYIHKESLMMDLKILLKTVLVVLDSEKSAGVHTPEIAYAAADTTSYLAHRSAV